MRRTYAAAEIEQRGRYRSQNCSSNAFYTAFNMGGGESCVIYLLHVLEQLPNGGLLVVEEVEAGLHPQAQIRLADVLIQFCDTKRIQVVCTTHSATFIDAIPRQARLLIRRSGGHHEAIESPSTRFATQELTGIAQPELMIYCEDRFASVMIEESLPASVLTRVCICDVGSDATVVRQGVAHIRSGNPMRCVCILDGDATVDQIQDWINAEQGQHLNPPLEYARLPGDDLPPELWITAQLTHVTYRAFFAQQFACTDGEAQQHIEAVGVEPNHHNVGFRLHQRTNLGIDECVRRLIRSVSPHHPQMVPIRERIEGLLD